MAVGIRFHLATKALARLGIEGLLRYKRYSMGLRSGICAGQSNFFPLDTTSHVFMDLTLLKLERLFPKLLPQMLEAHNPLVCDCML